MSELVSEDAGPAKDGQVVRKDAGFIVLNGGTEGAAILSHARTGIDPAFRERSPGEGSEFRAERGELLDDEVPGRFERPDHRFRNRRHEVVSGQSLHAEKPRLGPQIAMVGGDRFPYGR